MSLGMMSLMAGLSNGYVEGQRYEDGRRRQAAMDAISIDRAGRERADWDREEAERQGLATAAAPVMPEPDMMQTADGAYMQRLVRPESMDDRDIGQPGETAPLMASMRVAGRGGFNPLQAQSAAAAANTPEAIEAKQIAFLRGSNPIKAYGMQAMSIRAKASDIDFANRRFDSDLSDAAGRGWAALTDFTNKSGVSPTQTKWVPTADGKRGEVNIVQPDGSLKPTGMTFDNDAGGALEAATILSKSTPLDAKMQHFAARKDRRQAFERQSFMDTEGLKDKQQALGRADRQQASTEAYQGRMAGVAERNAETNEQYRRDLIRMQGVKAVTGGGRRADHFDEKQWDGANKIEPSFVTFSDPNGSAKGIESPELRQRYRQKLNQLRASGDYGPDEAAELARDSVLALKNAAEQRAAESRKANAEGGGWFSKPPPAISESEAVRQITNESQAAEKAAKAPSKGGMAAPASPAQHPASVPAATPQTAIVPTGRNPSPPDAIGRAGVALDAARAAVGAAQERMMRFGSVQRANDPNGFAAAQAQAAAAAVARERAEQEYRAAVAAGAPETSAAFGRYPKP